jgi:hypothetical protein
LEREELDKAELEQLLSPEIRSIQHHVSDEEPAPPIILAPTPGVG